MDLCRHQTYKGFSASGSDLTTTSAPSYSKVVSNLPIKDNSTEDGSKKPFETATDR